MVKTLKILWEIRSQAPKCVNDKHMDMVQRLDEYGHEEIGHL